MKAPIEKDETALVSPFVATNDESRKDVSAPLPPTPPTGASAVEVARIAQAKPVTPAGNATPDVGLGNPGPKTLDPVGSPNPGGGEKGMEGDPLKDNPLIPNAFVPSDDAYKMIQDTLTSWGMDEMIEPYISMLSKGMPNQEALFRLKTDDEYNYNKNPVTGAYDKNSPKGYKLRFAGNTARAAAGLNVLDERSYIAVENSYADTIRQYGLQGKLLSADAKANRAEFADWMSKGLDAPTFATRIKTAVESVQNADPGIKNMFKQYYNIDDNSLVAYFLDPKKSEEKLNAQARAAEVGNIAAYAGASIGEGTAYGVGQRSSASNSVLANQFQSAAMNAPAAQQMSNIYKEAGLNYNQETGVSEFVDQNADAAMTRQRLKSLQRGSFSAAGGLETQNNASFNKSAGSGTWF